MREIIRRAVDGLACAQRFEVLDEEIRLKRIGVVIVDLLALRKRQIVMRLVIAVMIHDRDAVAEMRLEAVRERGFSRTCAARNADDRRLHLCGLPEFSMSASSAIVSTVSLACRLTSVRVPVK